MDPCLDVSTIVTCIIHTYCTMHTPYTPYIHVHMHHTHSIHITYTHTLQAHNAHTHHVHSLCIPCNVHTPYDHTHNVPCTHHLLASFPGPAQVFVACSMEKRGEPGMFPREHYVTDKWPNLAERKNEVLHIVQPTTRSMLGVYDSRPPLARYMW